MHGHYIGHLFLFYSLFFFRKKKDTIVDYRTKVMVWLYNVGSILAEREILY